MSISAADAAGAAGAKPVAGADAKVLSGVGVHSSPCANAWVHAPAAPRCVRPVLTLAHRSVMRGPGGGVCVCV